MVSGTGGGLERHECGGDELILPRNREHAKSSNMDNERDGAAVMIHGYERTKQIK